MLMLDVAKTAISRFQALAHLDTHQTVWIGRDLSIIHPTLWQRLVYALFGCLQCVKNRYNVDYKVASDALRQFKWIIGSSSQDLRLKLLFNEAVAKFNTIVDDEDLQLIHVPALGQLSNQKEEEALLLACILFEWRIDRVEDLRHVNINRIKDLSPEALDLLLRSCPNLSSFAFDTMTKEQLDVLIKYKDRVKSLAIMDSTGLNSGQLDALAQFQLESLHIVNFLKEDPALPRLLTRIDWSRMRSCRIYGAPSDIPVESLPQGMRFKREQFADGYTSNCLIME